MKTFIIFTLILGSIHLHAQDTLIIYNNYKYKIGAKVVSEMSGDLAVSPNLYQVYSGGVQLIRRIKFSKFSLESGIYYNNKAYPNSFHDTIYAQNAYVDDPFYYHNLSLPVNLRYDIKILYFATGIYCDYLLFSNSNYQQNENNVLDMRTDRKLNFGFDFILGLESNLSKYINLFIQAQVLNNVTSSKLGTRSSSWTYFQNSGFAVGMNYKILKIQ